MQRFDEEHGKSYFRALTLDAIHVHEHRIEGLLAELSIPPAIQPTIAEWFYSRCWGPEALRHYYRPFPGVMDVIRWLQMQPSTVVGLNTGRLERMRTNTLAALNEYGQPHGVHFADELLFMRPDDWQDGMAAHKAAAIEHFALQGYRVIALLDNEPNNLAAIHALAETDSGPIGKIAAEALLLHADTIYLSPSKNLPSYTVVGDEYDITELIAEESLPSAVDMVWHGANDRDNLHQFLSSAVQWAELDVNLDPSNNRLILRHDRFAEQPRKAGETFVDLYDALVLMRDNGKSLKLDFKVGGKWIPKVLAMVDHVGFADEQLWFNANLPIFGERWIRHLAANYPNAIMQCPIGSFIPSTADVAQIEIALARVSAWGLNRISLPWHHPQLRALFQQLTDWGYETNIYGVTNLRATLEALLLQPRSVTCDYNFPQWGYYGRGSGHKGVYYEYAAQKRSRTFAGVTFDTVAYHAERQPTTS